MRKKYRRDEWLKVLKRYREECLEHVDEDVAADVAEGWIEFDLKVWVEETEKEEEK